VGLGPKLIGNFLSSYYSEKLADRLGLAAYEEKADNEEVDDTSEEMEVKDNEKLWQKFVQDTKRNVVVHSAGIFISQPFHVITVRMMAQFVGKEKIYNGLWSSFKEIYHEEGILGLFSGFFPRLLCDVGCLMLASGATYLVSRYFIKEKEGRVYFSTIAHFVISTFLYPLQLVSTCMVVSGTRLAAGRAPYMNYYPNSFDCYHHLKAIGQHKRGNSMFWRYKRYPQKDFALAPMPEIAKF
jgi:carrier protein